MLPIIKKVSRKMLPTIAGMHSIAMRYIFDRNTVTAEDRAILEEGIEGWSKAIDLHPVLAWELKRIINALIAEEHGFFDRAKELIKQHNVDYRKMYKDGLPFIEVEGRTSWNKS